MGLEVPTTVCTETGIEFPNDLREGKLPCMIGHENSQALTLRLSDGKLLQPSFVSRKIEPKNAKRAAKRYGDAHANMFGPPGATEEEIAENLFITAKKVFLKDKFHAITYFFLRQRKLIHLLQSRPENQAEKYLFMRGIADEVKRRGADAVICVGEVWRAPYDPEHPYRRSGDAPEREEALVVTLVSRSGDPVQFSAQILRKRRRVRLGDTIKEVDGVAFMFAPIYDAWGKEIPERWLAAMPDPDGG